MSKKIKIEDLEKDFYNFGNKGAVFNDEVHIAQSGSFSGVTLCDTPMLSSNHGRYHPTVGCPTCIEKYEQITKKS